MFVFDKELGETDSYHENLSSLSFIGFGVDMLMLTSRHLGPPRIIRVC